MNSGLPPQLLSSGYDRSACAIGIVHVGPGAFHRAHQALYIDAVMDKTGDLCWGIAAVNLRAAEASDLTALKNADQGYVLKTVSPTDEIEFRQIRSQISFADWSQDADSAESLMALTSVKMVTITVTESGYYLNENKQLNTADPIIKTEISGTDRSSIYAYLRAGLNKRREANAGPITVLCCDNLRSNGEILQRNFFDYLEHCDDKNLIDWLKDNTSFPCAMVDRITPKPPRTLAEEVAGLFARQNDPSVLAEDFIQWVIEDNFVAERPALEQVGVQIVNSVEPYEETKIRVLNGGHTGLTYLGALRGFQTFDQAIDDPQLHEHFMGFETEEVLPVLPADLPFDKKEYLSAIASRFKNPNVADSLQRICTDGFSKVPIFILPTIIDNFDRGYLPRRAIISIASWYVFAKRIQDGAMEYNYIEPNIKSLQPYLKDGAENEFANASELWGQLPENYPDFSSELIRQIDNVNHDYPV